MNTSFNLPLVIILLVGFYSEAPFELEEQGMLEGCNLFQRYFFITTPMVKAGLIAVGMLTFIASWNEFLYGVILFLLIRQNPHGYNCRFYYRYGATVGPSWQLWVA